MDKIANGALVDGGLLAPKGMMTTTLGMPSEIELPPQPFLPDGELLQLDWTLPLKIGLYQVSLEMHSRWGQC